MNANLGLLNTNSKAAKYVPRQYRNWFVLLMLDTPTTLEQLLDEMSLCLEPAGGI
jgi:hypothetical protein